MNACPPPSSEDTTPATPPVSVITVGQNRSITAAAQILNGPRVQRMARPKSAAGLAWQQDAWAYYDEIGEWSWAVESQALAVSKVRLVAGRDIPGSDEPEIVTGEAEPGDDDQPTPLDRIAADLIADFAGGSIGQQQLMNRVAIQLQVAAESYIVGRTVDGSEVWDSYSNEEVRNKAGQWSIDDGVDKFTLSPDDVLIRVWRPHARRRQEPRSPTKALLPVLAEIRGLTASIAAQIDSRLAGAGLLLLPESFTYSANPNADVADGEDPFIAELIDAMVTPIKDRESAASVVPIVGKVPDESIGKAQYIRFDGPVDNKVHEQREAAITRLARGMDMQPEAVLGMGDANHWSAWQIGDADITGPISSLASIVVHALTIGWYRPALEEAAPEGTDPELIAEYLVWFDTTPLVVRPDRSEQALQVFDRGGLSLVALLRESGFDSTDLPEDSELCKQLLLTLVKANPELAGPLLERLGVCAGLGNLDIPASTVVPGEVTTPAPDTDSRELPERPTVQASADDAGGNDCLLIACDVSVTRALELAGKRLLTREHRGKLQDTPSHLLHTRLPVPETDLARLTAGAWEILAGALPPGNDALVAQLDEYVRSLLVSGEPHSRDWLRPILNRCGA